MGVGAARHTRCFVGRTGTPGMFSERLVVVEQDFPTEQGS